jgi:MFS family permease
VAALFMVNGAMTGNLVPRFPDLKADLELSNTAFGSALGAYGLGALALGLLGGLLVRRFGSRRVAWVSSVAIAANLSLVGLAPSGLVLAAVLAVAGALDSFADIGANAHGLRVERIYGRSILNSLHGLWSIGAVVGGAMGPPRRGWTSPSTSTCRPPRVCSRWWRSAPRASCCAVPTTPRPPRPAICGSPTASSRSG